MPPNPKTKKCGRKDCKKRIPLKRHYCDEDRDEAIKAKKRECQKRARDRERAQTVIPEYTNRRVPVDELEAERLDMAKRLEDRNREKELEQRRAQLNPELLMLRVMRGATHCI